MNDEQMKTLLATMAEAYESLAPKLAQAEWAYYEALQEEGFSEDHAFELVKRMDDMSVTVNQ